MIDIWNITYGDEVSKDPKVGQQCLIIRRRQQRHSVQDINYIQVIYVIKSNECEQRSNVHRTQVDL